MLIVSCCSVLRGEGPPHHLDQDDDPLNTEQQATQDEVWDEVVSSIFEDDPPAEDEDEGVDSDDVEAMKARFERARAKAAQARKDYEEACQRSQQGTADTPQSDTQPEPQTQEQGESSEHAAPERCLHCATHRVRRDGTFPSRNIIKDVYRYAIYR